MSNIKSLAFTTHASCRKILYGALSFVFACLVFWYSELPLTPNPPEWEIVDLHIIDQQSTASTVQQHQSSAEIGKDLVHDQSPDLHSQSSAQKHQSSLNALRDKLRDYTHWQRPTTDHWPSWKDYEELDYDPNRWEGMDREYGFFFNATVHELQSQPIKSEPYLPYPRYNTDKWKRRWHGEYTACHGPHGKSYTLASNSENIVHGYRRPASTFPAEAIGSSSLLCLDPDICFDWYSRYGPYGMEGSSTSPSQRRVDWENTFWGRLQDECLIRNAPRFDSKSRVVSELRPGKQVRLDSKILDQRTDQTTSSDKRQYKSRTAILIRTWEGYRYRENDFHAIRALITETSLLSGGEYQVFLFVNIKDNNADIYEEESVHDEVLSRTVPQEFRDIAVLWSERVCEEWYPKVGDWQVYWMQFMPLQWFSNQHPEFEYVWNWEIDARYIGNHYHFLEQVTKFSRKMPRKHLWERNSRFFVPGLWNGSYDAFLADTDKQVLEATALGLVDQPIWGPNPYAPFQYPMGPSPPRRFEHDNFEWGVGEEADLITLQPIWDPAETGWSYRNHIWNFIPEVRPHFTPENGNADGFDHEGFSAIPRRVFINTVARFSRKMLHVMHTENLQGRSMQAEMWPATVALHHGLKAVYAPHPIWTDRKWPAWYAEAVFNANDGIPARWGQQQDSPYNHDREANFGGWSWYYRSVFPHILFRRWLGWTAKDWGWDVEQARALETEARKELLDKFGKTSDDTEELRMCLPGMMLHPVKNVYEGADGG